MGPKADRDRIPGIDVALGEGDTWDFGQLQMQGALLPFLGCLLCSEFSSSSAYLYAISHHLAASHKGICSVVVHCSSIRVATIVCHVYIAGNIRIS